MGAKVHALFEKKNDYLYLVKVREVENHHYNTLSRKHNRVLFNTVFPLGSGN